MILEMFVSIIIFVRKQSTFYISKTLIINFKKNVLRRIGRL